MRRDRIMAFSERGTQECPNPLPGQAVGQSPCSIIGRYRSPGMNPIAPCGLNLDKGERLTARRTAIPATAHSPVPACQK